MAVSEVPDESWSEDQLLELVRLAGQGAAADPLRVLAALDELSKRKIRNETDATKALLEAARVKGGSNPAARHIASVLIRLCGDNETCFTMFSDELFASAGNENFPFCASIVIAGLSREKQNTLTPVIIEAALAVQDDPKRPGPLTWIGSIGNPDIRNAMASQLSKELRSGSTPIVARAVRVAREVSSQVSMDQMLVILDRAVQGWYGQMGTEIETEVCAYLTQVPDPRASKSLLQILRKGSIPQVGKAIAAVSNETVVNELLDLGKESYEEQKKDPSNTAHQAMYSVLQTLNLVDPKFIDIKRLLSMEDLIENTNSIGYIKPVVVKVGMSAQPFLFDLLKSTKSNLRSFSLACLNDLGVTADEIAGVFEPPAVVQLSTFFFPDKTPAKLWANKKALSDAVKPANANNLEFLVQLLFSSFNILNFNVDSAGKQGVDVVGVSPVGLRIFVAGVTSGVIDHDLQKLDTTVRELKLALPILTSRFEVFPILFTRLDLESIPSPEKEYAAQQRMVIMSAQDIDQLLEFSRTGFTATDFINFLEARIGGALSWQPGA